MIQLSEKYQYHTLLVFGHVHRLHIDPLVVRSTKTSTLLGQRNTLRSAGTTCPALKSGTNHLAKRGEVNKNRLPPQGRSPRGGRRFLLTSPSFARWFIRLLGWRSGQSYPNRAIRAIRTNRVTPPTAYRPSSGAVGQNLHATGSEKYTAVGWYHASSLEVWSYCSHTYLGGVWSYCSQTYLGGVWSLSLIHI